MSSLVKKNIKEKQFFYIVDSKWVNRNSEIVSQIYVGAVDTVINMLKDINVPLKQFTVWVLTLVPPPPL